MVQASRTQQLTQLPEHVLYPKCSAKHDTVLVTNMECECRKAVLYDALNSCQFCKHIYRTRTNDSRFNK